MAVLAPVSARATGADRVLVVIARFVFVVAFVVAFVV